MTAKLIESQVFDCVEMMHQGAALVQRELQGKSLEQQKAYWRKGTEALRKRQEQLRRLRAHPGPVSESG
jgi:hypothetical protein